MDGKFRKNNTNRICGIACIGSGVFLAGLFLFLRSVDSSAAANCELLLGFSAFAAVLGAVLLFLNRKPYFHADEHSISAGTGYGRKLSCAMSQLAFVYPMPTGLTLGLKNGKRFTFHDLLNVDELTEYLRRQIRLHDDPGKDETVEELRFGYETAVQKRKQLVLGTAILLLPMLLSVAAALLLLFEDDFPSGSDLSLLTAYGAAFLIFSLTDILIARKAGKFLFVIAQQEALLRQSVIHSAPLPSGNPIRIFSDEEYSVRVTIHQIPNTQKLYYVVEAFDNQQHLVRIRDSELFDSDEELLSQLQGLHELHMK